MSSTHLSIHLHVVFSTKHRQPLIETTWRDKLHAYELGVREFGWQDGYGAFSVSPGHRARVVKYIRHQELHHRRTSFQQEYVRMLTESEVDYDPQYLW